MLPDKISSEGKKKKTAKVESVNVTPGGTPWVYCLVTNHCLLKLDLEFGLSTKSRQKMCCLFTGHWQSLPAEF